MKSIISIEARKYRFRYRDLKHCLFIVVVICLSFPLNAQFAKINIEDGNKNNSISTADLDGDNDLDVLALSIVNGDLRVHWFKNDGKQNFERKIHICDKHVWCK